MENNIKIMGSVKVNGASFRGVVNAGNNIDGCVAERGVAGFSPIANVTSDGDDVTITITDYKGTTTATVPQSVQWGNITGDINNQTDLGEALDSKQNVLTAGTGIAIENNIISNTQTSAEWGNITGDINNQTDLQNLLDNKANTDFSNITEAGIEVIKNNSIGGNVLFDTKLSDHILTYEETQGWALQGTYVYKEALAGSRYGYPDFYNKCLEEYSNSNNTYEILRNNYEIVGSPTITEDGVASGFNNSNYIQIKNQKLGSTTKISIKAKRQTLGISNETFFRITDGSGTFWRFYFNASGTMDYVCDGIYGMLGCDLNTTEDFIFNVEITPEQFKFSCFQGEQDVLIRQPVRSRDYINIFSSSDEYFMDLGSYTNVNGLLGSIDLKQFSITVDGEEVYRAVDYITTNSNGHRFYPISSKTLIDSTYEQLGMAWFYGVDTENERIFLPRNNYFEQATGTVSEVGHGVGAGLPNITGRVESVTGRVTGAFSDGGLAGTIGGGTQVETRWADLDLSTLNPIYGNSGTVQPNAVKKLLYICVGNTTNYEGITDVVNQGMEILEQVALKVNVDGTNLNTEGKSLLSGLAMPSDEYVDLTLGASGTTYTAPANGFFVASGRASTGASYGQLWLINTTNALCSQVYSTQGIVSSVFIPVKKGDVVSLTYGAFTIDRWRFNYAEGEV